MEWAVETGLGHWESDWPRTFLSDGRFDEDDLVPISALRHMRYCPRQCALIHVERLWAENAYTAEVRLLHKRVDAGGAELRAGAGIGRGVPLRSLRLGLVGLAVRRESGNAGGERREGPHLTYRAVPETPAW